MLQMTWYQADFHRNQSASVYIHLLTRELRQDTDKLCYIRSSLMRTNNFNSISSFKPTRNKLRSIEDNRPITAYRRRGNSRISWARHTAYMKGIYTVWSGQLDRKSRMSYQSADGSTILKCISKKRSVGMWIEFKSLGEPSVNTVVTFPTA